MVGYMEDNKFNSKFNEYLERCKENNHIKCAIVVTDKQCAISTEMDNNLSDTSHNNLAATIENMIHPNENKSGWDAFRLDNVYIFLEGPELIANLPLDGNLSINQAGFLIDVLGEVCKFNAANNNLIKIDVISSCDYKEYRNHDIKPISKHILSLITKKHITTEEIIIGKTIINDKNCEEVRKTYQKIL